MHSPLEAYLDQVAARLSALPAKRRNEELREMRQHLQNAVTVNRELGQLEEDAARNAVLQFGTPEDLGDNLVWAWRRERTLSKRSLWGSAAVTVLMVCLGQLSMNHADWNSILPRDSLIYLRKHPVYGMDFMRAVFLMNFALAGLIAGSLFPKRAAQGVCLGLAAFWIGWACVDGIGHYLTGVDRASWILADTVSAWAGSRLRLAWESECGWRGVRIILVLV